jgi:hypothetical protein
MKQITVEVRDIYGQIKFYPHCQDAKVFASIANTKTLTEETVRQVMKLGYKVKTLERSSKFIEGEVK